jgi:hypothetical protein
VRVAAEDAGARLPSPSQRFAPGPSLSHFMGEGLARAGSENALE